MPGTHGGEGGGGRSHAHVGGGQHGIEKLRGARAPHAGRNSRTIEKPRGARARRDAKRAERAQAITPFGGKNVGGHSQRHRRDEEHEGGDDGFAAGFGRRTQRLERLRAATGAGRWGAAPGAGSCRGPGAGARGRADLAAAGSC